MTSIPGVVHGRTIELAREAGLPDGQAVAVTLEPTAPIPANASAMEVPNIATWIHRLIFDPAINPTERIVRGTRLTAEGLVAELERGPTDEQMLLARPELVKEDLDALRHYARWPLGLRRSCGGWAEDADELDRYLQWTRQHRHTHRRGI